jgi:hypothetical protein
MSLHALGGSEEQPKTSLLPFSVGRRHAAGERALGIVQFRRCRSTGASEKARSCGPCKESGTWGRREMSREKTCCCLQFYIFFRFFYGHVRLLLLHDCAEMFFAAALFLPLFFINAFLLPMLAARFGSPLSPVCLAPLARLASSVSSVSADRLPSDFPAVLLLLLLASEGSRCVATPKIHRPTNPPAPFVSSPSSPLPSSLPTPSNQRLVLYSPAWENNLIRWQARILTLVVPLSFSLRLLLPQLLFHYPVRSFLSISLPKPARRLSDHSYPSYSQGERAHPHHQTRP